MYWQFTFYDTNIETLSSHRQNCSIAYDKLMAITCKGGWTYLLTTRAFIAMANQATSKVKADEVKQYSNTGKGVARTSGNVISFVDGT